MQYEEMNENLRPVWWRCDTCFRWWHLWLELENIKETTSKPLRCITCDKFEIRSPFMIGRNLKEQREIAEYEKNNKI